MAAVSLRALNREQICSLEIIPICLGCASPPLLAPAAGTCDKAVQADTLLRPDQAGYIVATKGGMDSGMHPAFAFGLILLKTCWPNYSC